MHSNRNGRMRQRGPRAFTLVEMIVVIVLIGLLASVVAFRTRSYMLVGKQNTARAEIARLVQALDTYYATHDRYPSNEEGLAALVAKSETFPDGIIDKVPLDPWKHPYQYVSPGRDAPYEV
ncbi:MAG: type II secretion system major pseudopilin GspG, partial [Planctomycetota bacterium]